MARKKFSERIDSFTVVACTFLVLQAMYASGFIPSTLTTFEREFGLSSLQASTIVTGYTMAKLFLGVPMTYFGGKQHVPRFLGITCLVCGLSAILTAIPYFMKSTDKIKSTSLVCFKDKHPDAHLCDGSHVKSSSGMEWFVIIAQVLNGAGATTLYTLIPAFINGNAMPDVATRHVGYYLACGPLGVAIGFVWGGSAVDGGGWGWPYFITGILMICRVPFFFMLPKHYEVGEELDDTNFDPRISMGSIDEPEPIRKRSTSQFTMPKNIKKEVTMKDFIEGSKIIIQNRVWWLLSLAATAEAFFVVGIANYGPKYIESQYSVSAGSASTIAGLILVPGAMVGQISGALMDSKLSKNMKQSSTLTYRIAGVAFLITCCIGLISCGNIDIHPVSPKCGESCNCVTTFDPVCVEGKKMYFNGCYLGCTGLDADTGIFSNCTGCVDENIRMPQNAEIKQGVCEGLKCQNMGLFLVVMFAIVQFTYTNNPPANMLQMRIVPPQHSAIALALSDIVYRLLGNFPGVTVFSAIFDASCSQFNTDVCGNKLSCSYYDNNKLRAYFAVLGAIPKFLSFLMFLAASIVLLKYRLSAALAPYKQDDSELGVSLSDLKSVKSDSNFESNDV